MSCGVPWLTSAFLSIAQVRGLDEESEATLLTALTEILDNVDDVENLSPFDTLPDSDLLSGQKAREHSPVSCQLLLPTPTHPPTHPRLSDLHTRHKAAVGGGWGSGLYDHTAPQCVWYISRPLMTALLRLLCTAEEVAVSVPLFSGEGRRLQHENVVVRQGTFSKDGGR